jgi:queuine tRNA-ribosyltransferase
MLNTVHNLHYYQTLMAEMREAIAAGNLTQMVAAFHRDRQNNSMIESPVSDNLKSLEI